jgi:cell division protein FtsB
VACVPAIRYKGVKMLEVFKEDYGYFEEQIAKLKDENKALKERIMYLEDEIKQLNMNWHCPK